jgi:hypothetical protein
MSINQESNRNTIVPTKSHYRLIWTGTLFTMLTLSSCVKTAQEPALLGACKNMFPLLGPQCNEHYGVDSGDESGACELISLGTGTYVPGAECALAKCIGQCRTTSGGFIEHYYTGGTNESGKLKVACEMNQDTWSDACE